MNVIGGTSDVGDFLRRNGDDPCLNSALRGRYCPNLTAPANFYHNVSLSPAISDRFEITFGIANQFNNRPPRVAMMNGVKLQLFVPVVRAYPYPSQGGRAFLNISAHSLSI